MRTFFSTFCWLSLFSAILTVSGQNCDFGWTAFKDAKCFKLMPDFVSLTEAEALCLQEVGGGVTATLLTIKSKEEQDFLSQLIFNDSQIVDNVWLGARRVAGTNQFQWTDGSDVDYTNWHEGSPSTIQTNECTQMVPKGVRHSADPTKRTQPMDIVDGRWTDVSCLKRNLVICQKLQPWTLLKLQQVVLELTKTVQDTRENMVPIGFVYVQLPNQADAISTWPDVQWSDVTSQYAGHFFRAEGGNSASFGTIQEDATRQIRTMEYAEGTSGYPLSLALPTSGWSQYGRGGGFYTSGSAYHYEGLRFEVSNSEVRPRNMAVRFWKRIA